MKFAVSFAMVVLLLGMPLGCILATCQIDGPAHPCCPRTAAKLTCPYDTFDSAKIANMVPGVGLPASDAIETASQTPNFSHDFAPLIVTDHSDSYILNRILRI